MTVSILITNYNYGKYLNRCIRSCLNQTFDDYEIIIVDDCSTDDSAHILSRYSNHPKIRVVYNPVNLGVGASSYIGLQHALGKYIIRIDADDYVNRHLLTCLCLYSETNHSYAVSSDYYIVDDREEILARMSARKHPIACSILWRTDMLERLGGYSVNKKKVEVI